jgi:hypothetical protein
VGSAHRCRARSAHAKRNPPLIEQVVFLKRRPGISMAEFLDYYENQHAQLSKKLGAKPALPNAQRYVRRYITPEKNPLTGEKLDSGYDCIMEIWWNNREDFEAAMNGLSDPRFLEARMADERKLFASNSNPVCTVEEHDSPVGPENRIYDWVPVERAETHRR